MSRLCVRPLAMSIALLLACGTAALGATVLMRTNGTVYFVRSIDGADDRLPIAGSVIVSDGATAQTDPGASALVTFPDLSTLRLEGATRVRIGGFTASGTPAARLTLAEGTVRLAIHQPSETSFVIATQNLEVRAWGAASVRTDSASTRVSCISGHAVVTSRDGETIELQEHQTLAQTWDPQGMREMHLDPMQ